MARRLIHYPWIINSILLNAWKQRWGGGEKKSRGHLEQPTAFGGRPVDATSASYKPKSAWKRPESIFHGERRHYLLEHPSLFSRSLSAGESICSSTSGRKERKKKEKKNPSSEVRASITGRRCWIADRRRKSAKTTLTPCNGSLSSAILKKKKKRKNHSAPINCRSGGIRCWCRATRLEPSTCTHMHTHSLSPLFPLPLTLCWSCEKLLWVTGSSGGDKIN